MSVKNDICMILKPKRFAWEIRGSKYVTASEMHGSTYVTAWKIITHGNFKKIVEKTTLDAVLLFENLGKKWIKLN